MLWESSSCLPRRTAYASNAWPLKQSAGLFWTPVALTLPVTGLTTRDTAQTRLRTMNKHKLYQSLALQWDLLDALQAPDSEQRQRKLRLGCLLLVLEAMRQTGEWREA